MSPPIHCAQVPPPSGDVNRVEHVTHSVDNDGLQHDTYLTKSGAVCAAKVTRPDGSVSITMRGCGDAMCAKETCYLHEGVITLDVDGDGKSTYNGPEYMRPFFRVYEDPRPSVVEASLKELFEMIARIKTQIKVLAEWNADPKWAAHKARLGTEELKKTAKLRSLDHQAKELFGLKKRITPPIHCAPVPPPSANVNSVEHVTHPVDNEGLQHDTYLTKSGHMCAAKVTRPDGSVKITMRGCGNATCYLHEGLITLNVDVDGKRTYDGPEYILPLFRVYEDPRLSVVEASLKELCEKFALVTDELKDLAEYYADPGYACECAECAACKSRLTVAVLTRLAVRRSLEQQFKELRGLKKETLKKLYQKRALEQP